MILFTPIYNESFHLTFPLQAARKFTKSVRKFYFGDAAINEKTLSNYYDYLSDVNFVLGSDRTVKLHAEHVKGNTFYAW